jgi:hypothetical protein
MDHHSIEPCVSRIGPWPGNRTRPAGSACSAVEGRKKPVLSFAVIADYFPKEIAARANGALNLLHFGCAFAVQYGIGFVVGHWPALDGHYPIVAYQYAFGLSLAFQAAALVWFISPWLAAVRRIPLNGDARRAWLSAPHPQPTELPCLQEGRRGPVRLAIAIPDFRRTAAHRQPGPRQ